MAKRIKYLLLAGVFIFSQLTFNVAFLGGNASAVVPGINILVSVDNNGSPASGESSPALMHQSISNNGNRILFRTAASLVPEDTDGIWDYYVRDVANGTTERVLATSYTGQQHSIGDADRPSISGNGQFIAFDTTKTLTTEDGTGRDVFILDLETGATELISKSAFPGQKSSGHSTNAKVSRDGNSVVFTSSSNSLTNPTSSPPGSYLRNRLTGTTTRLDKTMSGGYATSGSPDVSCDGRHVVFGSSSSLITPDDTNGVADIFLYDSEQDTYQNLTGHGNGHSGGDSSVQTSCDGGTILFASLASNLVPGDTNNVQDNFTYNIDRATFSRVNVNSNEEQANGYSDHRLSALSGNGRYVVFESMATNLAPGNTSLYKDIFLRDVEAGTTELLSTNPTHNHQYQSEWPSISDDGSYAVFKSAKLALGDTNPYLGVYRAETGIDDTSPAVTGTPGRAPDFGDWYNNDVTIDWQATDDSGSATDPADTIASLEGEHAYTSDQSCDPAGNCATGSLTLKIDKTAPVLSTPVFSADPIAYGTDSTLTVPVTEPTSGVGLGEYFIGTDPGPGNGTPMNWDGTNLTTTLGASLPVGTHTVNIRARDNAGNWSGVATATLTVQDNTAPVITYSLDQMPGLGGWFNAPVVLTWNVSDPESAITSQTGCDAVTVNADTAGTTYTCEATSAGGTASESTTIMYDATAPTASTPLWSINPLPVGSDTTLTVPVVETLSGVTNGEYFIDTDPGESNGTPMNWDGINNNLSATFGATLQPGVYTVGVRAKDLAGNWGQITYDYLVVYDPAGPTDVTGKKRFTPSLANGDVLPGLTSSSQTDQADFGFDVFYTSTGTVDPTSEFTFCYDPSNKKCKKPQNNPFSLTATSFSLLSVSGAESESAVFQGSAEMTENGLASTVSFRVEVLDADLTPETTDVDHLVLKVYPVGGSPSSPTYQVSADITGGNNLKIQ